MSLKYLSLYVFANPFDINDRIPNKVTKIQKLSLIKVKPIRIKTDSSFKNLIAIGVKNHHSAI